MKRLKRMLGIALTGFTGLAPSPLWAIDPPGIMNHQGRLTYFSINHDGLAWFKFALVDGAGTTTFWSNDGTGSGGNEPTDSVEVTVSKGHYAVPLGDLAFHANMNNAIVRSVFTDNADVRLRIWASVDDVTFELVSPDRRVTASGYALNAARAEGVPVGAITKAMLAPGAAAGNIDMDGVLGIGLPGGQDPGATIHLAGSAGYTGLVVHSQHQDGGSFGALAGARSLFVTGTSAFIGTGLDDAAVIHDISDPANPVWQATVVDGGPYPNLEGVSSVFVEGNFLYVTAEIDSALTLVNVTNPASPSFVSDVTQAQSIHMEGASDVYVAGFFAYVSSSGGGGSGGALVVIDVSSPGTPVVAVELDDVGDGLPELAGANSVHVEGSVAYVTADATASGGGLSIFDVGDPMNPSLLFETGDGFNGFNALEGASDVTVSGTRAYVTAALAGALTTPQFRRSWMKVSSSKVTTPSIKRIPPSSTVSGVAVTTTVFGS